MYWTFGVFLIFYSALGWANLAKTTSGDLIMMEFEELVNMDAVFSSAGKLKNRVKDLPYPAYVLSARDIAQAGAQSLPEALRLVPGIFMGQISSNEWFLAVRGSGGRYSRYVLVMVDGRIAYNNLFSGVNWDEMNLAIDSIDRIEVVRGPNGASWGPNAVNGIIHIITKRHASDDKSRLSVLGGSQGQRGVSLQWQRPIFDNWSLMFNAQHREWDGLTNLDGDREEGTQNWRTQLSLSRETDSNRSRIIFDSYGSYISPTYTWVTTQPPQRNRAALDDSKSGAVFLAEHSSEMNRHFAYTLRTAIDSVDSESLIHLWNETNYQSDLELLGNFDRHRLAVGVNWRRSDTNIVYKDILQASIGQPDQIIDHIGAYISDRVALSQQLSLTLSLRWDDHDLSQPETQPSARLMWRANEYSRLWLAHSQAVSTPARTILDTENTPVYLVQNSNLPLPVISRFAGFDKNTDATRISANEVGWRNAFNKFNIDLVLFQHNYKNGVSASLLGTPSIITDELGNPLYIDQPLILANNQDYASAGGEFSSRIQWHTRWTAQLSLSRFKTTDRPTDRWNTTAVLQNSLQLSSRWNLNATLRHAEGEFTTPSLTDGQIISSANDRYVIADLNLVWTPNTQWQVSAMAKNLGKKHVEASREQFRSVSNQVEPYGLVKMEYKFQ